MIAGTRMRMRVAASFPTPVRIATSAVSYSLKSGLMLGAESTIAEQRKAMTPVCLRISFIALSHVPLLRDRVLPTCHGGDHCSAQFVNFGQIEAPGSMREPPALPVPWGKLAQAGTRIA